MLWAENLLKSPDLKKTTTDVCVCVFFVLQGNCPKVSSINDRSDWKVVRKALSVIGFSDDEVEVRELKDCSCRYNEINFT